ncbi:CDP-diacylglycerol--glycerol-3-phosphate 3-phosphatidyltransferase [Erysiphe neolycopersici]|uniref:CDP-diacylglycerol--glycerol-3-phosphate 3-phosphatidyltransferase n=1 Tax=Erysiphe neolycopersici TaxID=212602 RepID=A0A420HWU1_9PEZI|nr:CDP-diacylglycerol--glycerol-3-phosphate 3-phosphatidyltransferase [Erysiphe neolycopersici]
MLRVFTEKLDTVAPSFRIQGSKIKIISSPIEFYETIKSKLLTAEKRIFLSTLYIGVTEYEFISKIQISLRLKPDLKLYILTDALRGTRESPSSSCASLLVPLITEFGPDRIEIRMYHTPNLTGLKKRLIPRRVNEGWGLQHMKLYGFDDEIIISGANLSSDYFTNRQDRYHLFSSKNITNYFFRLHVAISRLSFLVLPNSNSIDKYRLEWPASNLAPSPLVSPSHFVSESSKVLMQMQVLRANENFAEKSDTFDTVIYPIVQLKPLSCHHDSSTEFPALKLILSTLTSTCYRNSSWMFTAGYFNPTQALTELLLSTSSSSNTVITASPWANGFYGSKGVSGLIPSAYTFLLHRFLQIIQRKNRTKDIAVKEWRHGTVGEPDGWTYHAKGIWISLGRDNRQVKSEVDISVVGSSNYTKRSYSLDLEAGVIILTNNLNLKKQLAKERDALEENAKTISYTELSTPERRVGLKVRLAMWIVSTVGGAL